MCLESAAADLRRLYAEAVSEQNALAGRIAEMVCSWDKKLEPIKAVMQEYNMKFVNQKVSGETSKGIIVGATDECLYVLCGKVVKAVCVTTDEYFLEERTHTVKDYVKQCDLEILKCGFESVANIDTVPVLTKNNELSDFLKGCKDYFLNK